MQLRWATSFGLDEAAQVQDGLLRLSVPHECERQIELNLVEDFRQVRITLLQFVLVTGQNLLCVLKYLFIQLFSLVEFSQV